MSRPRKPPTLPGVPFRVVGIATLTQTHPDGSVTEVEPGGTVYLADPAQAWQLVCAGHVRMLDAKGRRLLDETDQCVLLDFAVQGVPFVPADWRP